MSSGRRAPLSTPNSSQHESSAADKVSWYGDLEHRLSSAGVFCVAPNGTLLIVKATYKSHWSLPSGIIDAGETPRRAAVRETWEEVGITLDERNLIFVYVVDRYSEAFGHTYQFIFHAEISDEQASQIVLQKSEIGEYAFLRRDEIQAAEQSRALGKVIHNWADGVTGYIEQEYRADD